jgi:hypothetical protein
MITVTITITVTIYVFGARGNLHRPRLDSVTVAASRSSGRGVFSTIRSQGGLQSQLYTQQRMAIVHHCTCRMQLSLSRMGL